jgi:hypothetical protein
MFIEHNHLIEITYCRIKWFFLFPLLFRRS